MNVRQLTTLVGAAALALSAGGCHFEDTFPYDSGEVVGGNIDFTFCGDGAPFPECVEYRLRLETVLPRVGRVRGWQPVPRVTFLRCQMGEEWREDRPGGCPA